MNINGLKVCISSPESINFRKKLGGWEGLKNYAPKRKEYSERDTVDMRYVKGEITKEKYEQMIKDIDS